MLEEPEKFWWLFLPLPLPFFFFDECWELELELGWELELEDEFEGLDELEVLWPEVLLPEALELKPLFEDPEDCSCFKGSRPQM